MDCHPEHSEGPAFSGLNQQAYSRNGTAMENKFPALLLSTGSAARGALFIFAGLPAAITIPVLALGKQLNHQNPSHEAANVRPESHAASLARLGDRGCGAA